MVIRLLTVSILIGFITGAIAQETPFPKSLFLSRVTTDVSRIKTTRTEGGDWDDKQDSIAFKIKLRNGDPNKSFDGIKIDLFVFGQSIENKKAYRLLQRTQQTISLAPLQVLEIDTTPFVSKWDDTDAIFGEKYKGWYLRVHSPDGQLLLEKNVSSFLGSTESLDTLVEGKYYDKDLKPATNKAAR